jgi:hypothetical protein
MFNVILFLLRQPDLSASSENDLEIVALTPSKRSASNKTDAPEVANDNCPTQLSSTKMKLRDQNRAIKREKNP